MKEKEKQLIVFPIFKPYRILLVGDHPYIVGSFSDEAKLILPFDRVINVLNACLRLDLANLDSILSFCNSYGLISPINEKEQEALLQNREYFPPSDILEYLASEPEIDASKRHPVFKDLAKAYGKRKKMKLIPGSLEEIGGISMETWLLFTDDGQMQSNQNLVKCFENLFPKNMEKLSQRFEQLGTNKEERAEENETMPFTFRHNVIFAQRLDFFKRTIQHVINAVIELKALGYDRNKAAESINKMCSSVTTELVYGPHGFRRTYKVTSFIQAIGLKLIDMAMDEELYHICENCDNLFEKKRKDQRYCSRACLDAKKQREYRARNRKKQK